MKKQNFYFFCVGKFSQWHKSPFKVNDVVYNCAEQFMMQQKALIFNDLETAQKIMKTSNPKKQKELGRAVKNFHPQKWNDVAKEIAFLGNYAKFSQNPVLRRKLILTGDVEIAEASPIDTIWGIGLSDKHPDAWDKNKWKGTNWLGEILMKVRTKLKEESNEQ